MSCVPGSTTQSVWRSAGTFPKTGSVLNVRYVEKLKGEIRSLDGGGGSLWIMPCVLNQCYPVLDRRGLQRLLSCVEVKGSSKVIILFKGEGLSMIIIFCRRGGGDEKKYAVFTFLLAMNMMPILLSPETATIL